jgi:Zn-dependent protease with chaperone function
MWVLALLAFSIITTILYTAWRRVGERYRIDKLALISWGATIMFTVDTVYAYLEGEEPIEFSIDAALLSATLIGVAIFIWLVALLYSRKH